MAVSRQFLVAADIWILAELEVRGVRIFERAIDAIREADIKAWLTDWDRAVAEEAAGPQALRGGRIRPLMHLVRD